jgi:8-oxo-dGTP diphosphatase
MGHPARAVHLPTTGYEALADDVERVAVWHGAPPPTLAALLRGEPRVAPAQLAAIAWVFDATRRRILLVEHRTFGWSCPGGHVEHGEHPADAAARELTEETGLRLSPDDRLPVTVALAAAPADSRGPAHDHWLVGYRFTASPDAVLVPERDPVAWHAVTALPHARVDDLAPLLAALT